MRLAVREKISEIISSDKNTKQAIADEYGIDPRSFDLSENDGELEIVKKLNELMRSDDIILREMLTTICRESPEREMLNFDGVKYTCGEMLRNVEDLAVNFIEIGIKKGTKTAVILDNCIEYIYSYFALFYIGALPVPINIRWKKDELYRVLDNVALCDTCGPPHVADFTSRSRRDEWARAHAARVCHDVTRVDGRYAPYLMEPLGMLSGRGSSAHEGNQEEKSHHFL